MAPILESGIGRFVVSVKPSKMRNNVNSLVHKINGRLYLSFSTHFPFRFKFPPSLWSLLIVLLVIKLVLVLYITIKRENSRLLLTLIWKIYLYRETQSLRTNFSMTCSSTRKRNNGEDDAQKEDASDWWVLHLCFVSLKSRI